MRLIERHDVYCHLKIDLCNLDIMLILTRNTHHVCGFKIVHLIKPITIKFNTYNL